VAKIIYSSGTLGGIVPNTPYAMAFRDIFGE